MLYPSQTEQMRLALIEACNLIDKAFTREVRAAHPEWFKVRMQADWALRGGRGEQPSTCSPSDPSFDLSGPGSEPTH